MENLEIYERVRNVPETAKKAIGAGRLKGKTDINPMWRIKVLTEVFGPCGIGWKTQIVRTWTDECKSGVVIASVEILLFVKVDGEWSDGIPGIGGSCIVAKESNGMYDDDEGYKKAYTDAISVACKALGVGADVYYDRDATKYDPRGEDGATQPPVQKQPKPQGSVKASNKYGQVKDFIKGTDVTFEQVEDWIFKSFGRQIRINDLSDAEFEKLMAALTKKKEEQTNV